MADPLGTGVATGLSVFGGTVLFLDLLENPQSDNLANIELPPGSLQGINILDDLDALYLSYDGRAFDKSILDLSTAEIIKRNGLPVTAETSPLSLSGFGVVSYKQRPASKYWTQCPSQDKRTKAMAESIKQHRSPCSEPGVCQCYGF